MKENIELIELLIKNKFVIFEGKELHKYMLLEIIKYIESKKKLEENIEIALITENLTEEAVGTTMLLIEKYKKVKIITNHPEQFLKIENKILEETGYPIIITKNKQKALKKSTIIINLNFEEEEINKYNIYENSIIISIGKNIKIKSKRFNGTVIHDYKLNLDKQECERKLYEQRMVRNKIEEANLSKFEISRIILNEEKIQITELVTAKGRI